LNYLIDVVYIYGIGRRGREPGLGLNGNGKPKHFTKAETNKMTLRPEVWPSAWT